MEKVIFQNENDEKLFVVLDLKGFRLPAQNESVVWMKMFFMVRQVIHNYDEKQIEVTLRQM